MKIGIVGFAGSGKSTVFQWITGVKPDPAASQRGQVGIAKIPDDRLTWLSNHFKPKKTTPAVIEFMDTPGLVQTEQRDNPRRLGIIRDADGLLIVLNGFGGGDLAQELHKFREELLFADLQIVTNRVSKLEDQLTRKKSRPAKEREADEVELALLKRIVKALEEEQTLANVALKEEEEKGIRSFQLLLLKPQLVLAAIGDGQLGQALPEKFVQLAPQTLSAAAKLEMELEELSAEDRLTFMQDLGLKELTRERTLRDIYQAMKQIVFFTVGEDECRAWGIPEGADAVTGAAQIHTDLSRGFVRAEVVAYEDFRKVGSMKEAKTHGVYRLEGKTYLVKDGDIMHILAST